MSRLVEPRALSDDDKALKTTTAALIKACGGPVAVAAIVGCAQSLISSYGSQSFPDRFMPVRLVLELEGLCGRPIVSRWLVDRADASPGIDRGQLALADAITLGRETAEAQLSILAALADGAIDAAERAAIRREIDDCLTVFTALRGKVEQP